MYLKVFKLLKNFLFDEERRFLYLSKLGFYKSMPSEEYLSRLFVLKQGYRLNLENPSTFNEKIQYLKLNDYKPIYTDMVDKIRVKEIVADIIGKEHIVPTIGVWDDVEKIDFNALPNQFVLKCNHNSAVGLCVCKDKTQLDIKKVEKGLKKGLRENYYFSQRELPYKNIKPMILAEQYLEDSKDKDLKDYKIFVFNGVAKFIQVDYDRFTNHHRNFYDREWNYVPFTTCYPTNPTRQIKKPQSLDEMLGYAERICEAIGIPAFLRVDFYIVNGCVYFGEATFYHGAGMEVFYPPEYDLKLGEMIKLGVRE